MMDGKTYLVENDSAKPWETLTLGFVKALQDFAPDIGHTVIAFRDKKMMVWQVLMPTIMDNSVIVSSVSTGYFNYRNLDMVQLYDQGYNLGKDNPARRLRMAHDTLIRGGNVEAVLQHDTENNERDTQHRGILLGLRLKGLPDAN
jgi:hypothetical protein